jgi:hypothetical protein
LFAVQVPKLLLTLGLCGAAGAIVGILRNADRSSAGAGRRAALLAMVLAAFLPVLVTVATRPAMYNGIRHFVFVLPPFAALAGLAVAYFAERLRVHGKLAAGAGILVIVAGIASPILDMVRLHPYEYTDYNRIAGGVPHARQNYMLDYWGLSLTQASRRLLTELADRDQRPPQGQWKIAVCGPHPPVAVALGPQFTTTWNPKGADFAMVVGEFYCAKLDAPVVFDIVREGVIYARVYDLRGRMISSLLTVPGIEQTNY